MLLDVDLNLDSRLVGVMEPGMNPKTMWTGLAMNFLTYEQERVTAHFIWIS